MEREQSIEKSEWVQLARAFYNASGVTPRNDPSNPASAFATHRIRKQLPRYVQPGMKVLDLGCGAGRYTFAVDTLGAKAIGIDCAFVPLRHAHALAHQWRSTCRFLGAVLPYLPFAARSFDLALLPGNNIVEFSPEDMDHLAKELARILSPNSFFCHDLRPGKDEVGPQLSNYSVPGKGRFVYQSYCWTLDMAKDIIGTHLQLVEEEALENSRNWLVF
jgi:ubiquinone/menaquinone biosynthesis C-methylase UbiE